METIKPKVVLDAESWREGYKAGASGQPSRNPYHTDDPKGLAWISGYIEGKAKPGTPPPEKSLNSA